MPNNVVSCSQDLEARTRSIFLWNLMDSSMWSFFYHLLYLHPGPSSVKLNGTVACDIFLTIYLYLEYNIWEFSFLKLFGSI